MEKRDIKKFMALLLALVILVLACTACGAKKQEVQVVFSNNSYELNLDEALVLNYSVFPANANKSDFKFSTMDENVATVSSTGVVRGISPGATTITLSTSERLLATCTVVVSEIREVWGCVGEVAKVIMENADKVTDEGLYTMYLEVVDNKYGIFDYSNSDGSLSIGLCYVYENAGMEYFSFKINKVSYTYEYTYCITDSEIDTVVSLKGDLPTSYLFSKEKLEYDEINSSLSNEREYTLKESALMENIQENACKMAKVAVTVFAYFLYKYNCTTTVESFGFNPSEN